MERTDRGAWLRLDSPRETGLSELQDKTPVSSSPTKKRAAPTALRVVEVVLTLRDAGQQVGPFPAHL